MAKKPSLTHRAGVAGIVALSNLHELLSTTYLLGPGQATVTATFDGGQLVTDAGLLAIRELDKSLGVLADVAQRLPDPYAQKFVTHQREALLTQQVYQILADYADERTGSHVPHAQHGDRLGQPRRQRWIGIFHRLL